MKTDIATGLRVAVAVVVIGGLFAAGVWFSVRLPRPAEVPAPTPYATPFTHRLLPSPDAPPRPVVSWPGTEAEARRNPAVLRCWLRPGDRYEVVKREALVIGEYALIRAVIDGETCSGWVRE